MDYYESLQKYYENGCVLYPGQTPKWGEVGYKEHIQKQISDMNIKPGDIIRVEQKWHNGRIDNYEGIVLHMYPEHVIMLSKGKQIWKDRSNEKDVFVEYVTKIEKVKDANPNFDIYKADPYYNYKFFQEHENNESEFWKKIEEKRIAEFKEKITTDFPQIDINKNIILWMLFDFHWPYSNGIVKKAELNIITENGCSIPLPNYKNKHIYPNHFYYSCCGTTATNKENDGILLFFNSYEEIKDIRLISCTWTVEFDDVKTQFLQMIYPKFIKKKNNVYNIRCRCTDMGEYERALHHHSVFSGALEKDYDKAFVRISDAEGEAIIEIMNAENVVEENLMDAVLCLNKNNLQNVIESLCNKEQVITEVFIKNTEVEPKGYIYPY